MSFATPRALTPPATQLRSSTPSSSMTLATTNTCLQRCVSAARRPPPCARRPPTNSCDPSRDAGWPPKRPPSSRSLPKNENSPVLTGRPRPSPSPLRHRLPSSQALPAERARLRARVSLRSSRCCCFAPTYSQLTQSAAFRSGFGLDSEHNCFCARALLRTKPCWE